MSNKQEYKESSVEVLWKNTAGFVHAIKDYKCWLFSGSRRLRCSTLVPKVKRDVLMHHIQNAVCYCQAKISETVPAKDAADDLPANLHTSSITTGAGYSCMHSCMHLPSQMHMLKFTFRFSRPDSNTEIGLPCPSSILQDGKPQLILVRSLKPNSHFIKLTSCHLLYSELPQIRVR